MASYGLTIGFIVPYKRFACLGHSVLARRRLKRGAAWCRKPPLYRQLSQLRRHDLHCLHTFTSDIIDSHAWRWKGMSWEKTTVFPAFYRLVWVAFGDTPLLFVVLRAG